MKIQVPVITETDCLMIGGTVDACGLAVRLRRAGLGVFCVTPYSYFGNELCATLDLNRDRIRELGEQLGLTVWNANPAGIKQMLDSALISAGVEYLYENRPVAPMKR